MGGACSMYRGEARCIQGFGGGSLRERDHLEDRRRWEGNIKMDLQEVGWGMDWIYLAQDRDR